MIYLSVRPYNRTFTKRLAEKVPWLTLTIEKDKTVYFRTNYERLKIRYFMGKKKIFYNNNLPVYTSLLHTDPTQRLIIKLSFAYNPVLLILRSILLLFFLPFMQS